MARKYPGTIDSRFWDKVDAGGDCWEWSAAQVQGYGTYVVPGVGTVRAHRYAYALLVGPIPDGLTLDHLCRVRHCVNPDHLQPVTQRVNLARSPIQVTTVNAQKTHCIHGHPYDETNTRMSLEKGIARRQCRTCLRVNARRFHARRATTQESP